MSTADTQTSIITFLAYKGHVAHRNHTTGVYDPKRMVFRTLGSATRGVGDILCCLKGGRWLEIEVKTGRDRMKPSQIARRAKVLEAGGLYWVVRTFDEFHARYMEYEKLHPA